MVVHASDHLNTYCMPN